MKKQNRSAIAAWVIPSLFLIIVIFIMMFSFSSKSTADASDTISENLIKSAQTYGKSFSHELETLDKVAGSFCVLLGKNPDLGSEYAMDMVDILYSSTDAFKVILCDNSGQGVNQQGETVRIGNEEYFQNIQQSDTPAYVYADHEQAIVIVQRVESADSQYYMLMYYQMDKFGELMEESDFDSDSFLALTDSEGNILGVSGAIESELLQGGNLIETVRKENEDEAHLIRHHMDNGSLGISVVTVSKEKYTLAYVPFGEEGWEIVLGVSQDYVDRQVNLQRRTTRNMMVCLIVTVSAFICLIVVVNIIGRIRNNEEKKELEDKADTDLLTGLNNKLATERKIKEYMAKNPNSQSMLFILDVDDFKKINDTMGHAFGDEVLRSLGQQLPPNFRSTDIIGRVGGDEFMIFLKGVTEADSVRKEAAKVENFFRNFKAGEYIKYAATASIGVAIFPQEGNNFEDLYKAADQSLYKAKKRGKNQIAFYREEWLEAQGEQD